MVALSKIADDLGAYLQEAAPSLASIKPERVLTSEQVDVIAGGVLDYVFAKAAPGDSGVVLGEAAVVGALAAAHDFGVAHEAIADAVVEQLERMAVVARSALTEMSAPSAADKKLLAAIKGSKGKHLSAKQVATDVGADLKQTIVALNKLQSAGLVDYNLKTGYSVPK